MNGEHFESRAFLKTCRYPYRFGLLCLHFENFECCSQKWSERCKKCALPCRVFSECKWCFRIMQRAFSNTKDFYLFFVVSPVWAPFDASSSPIPRMRIWFISLAWCGRCTNPTAYQSLTVMFPLFVLFGRFARQP